MNILQSFILGLIQGLTEFLPISSSGHLILMPRLFNWPDQGMAFDTVLHLATALSIVIVLRSEIWQILSSIFKSKSKKQHHLIYLIVIAIIPAGIIGFFFKNWIESQLRSTTVVAVSLIFWGLVLWVADNYSNRQKNQTKNLEKITWKQSILIGLMQVIALIPGTSRSGITITGGLFSRLDKETAVKFSFLIGLPLILAAGTMQSIELVRSGIACTEATGLIIGFFSALVSGILAMKFLLILVKKYSLKIFTIYRIILGIIILLIM